MLYKPRSVSSGDNAISHNTWIHRFVKVGVIPLARTPITPNHLTFARLATGVGAAGVYAFAGQNLFWAASLLFVISVLLDRADGVLARITDQESALGHKLDIIADFTVNSLIFIGIGLGIRDGDLGMWSIAFGVYTGLAISAIFVIVARLEAASGARSAELPSYGGFDTDDAILLVPVAVTFGLATELLIASVIGSTIFLAIFVVQFFKSSLR